VAARHDSVDPRRLFETFLSPLAFLHQQRGVPMRLATILLASWTLVATAVSLVPAEVPQTKLSVTNLYDHPFDVDFPAGQRIRLDFRSGEFRVVGRDANKISVRANGQNAEKAREMTVTFKHFGNHADLQVSSGAIKDGPAITVEVPKISGLVVRMPFGDLTVEGVSGDKDVELHAGDLDIAVGAANDYGHVDASVNAGDLSAEPFGESRDGLFRSFQKTGTGRYRLHAHVGAGDLTLH
jgi:hypothetical protein